jgi:hypothetical protein
MAFGGDSLPREESDAVATPLFILTEKGVEKTLEVCDEEGFERFICMYLIFIVKHINGSGRGGKGL